MELKPANILLKLLVWGLEIFVSDIENFFAEVHFLHHEFLKSLSTKWKVFLGGITKSSCSSEPLYQHFCIEKSGDEKRIGFAEMNMMLNRVGMVGLDDCENKSNLDEEDLMALFDEEEPSIEEIRESFKVFDVNDDGFIDAGELQRVICSLGVKEWCSLDDCKRMIHHFDSNGDGFIDFQEFIKFMENCLS